MIKKRSVLMVQVNYRFGDNVFIPYSVGSLQAYAQTFSEIRESFQFQAPLFLRESAAEVLKRIEKPSVACFSSYLWNWEYNKTLAKAVREAFPKCLIIFGGTQIPNNSEGFFSEHQYADLLVHCEGELTFTEILRQFLLPQPDYTRIPGLSIRVNGDQTFKTRPSERIRDLSKLPSPYLSGIFDFLIGRPFTLNASQETNRGCPYGCTFCDWGGNTYDKIFPFDEARILEEFDWFGRYKIDYLFNCDANFGILPRDHGLVEKMVAIRAKYGGHPLKFRMCTAKNSNDRIFAIAKVLSDAGMNKGATLSFQSLDANTLNIVRRSNIKPAVFSALMNQYRKAGIPTYTELIMGLPGETYESTKKGVDALIDGQDDVINIFVFLCSVLPNSEMNHPAYIEQHKIKSVRMPILLGHSTPESESLIEYQNVVVETATMPNKDWQRVYLFYWAVQAFHCLGLLRHIAIICRKELGIRYSDFYEGLIEYFTKNKNTLVGEQISLTKNAVERSVGGGRLDLVLPEFGNIYWPLEEASFLTFVTDKEKFYREIRSFIETLASQLTVPVDNDLLDDLVLYQSATIKDPHVSEVVITIQHDLYNYFGNLRDLGTAPSLVNRPVRLRIKAGQSFSGNLESYAKEVVWYGRKGGRFHHSDITRINIDH